MDVGSISRAGHAQSIAPPPAALADSEMTDG